MAVTVVSVLVHPSCTVTPVFFIDCSGSHSVENPHSPGSNLGKGREARGEKGEVEGWKSALKSERCSH